MSLKVKSLFLVFLAICDSQQRALTIWLPGKPRVSRNSRSQHVGALLTHGRPRCRTHRPGWHSSQAAGRTAQRPARSRTPNPHWCYSDPLETWRQNRQEPAPAHPHSEACRGTSPAGSADGDADYWLTYGRLEQIIMCQYVLMLLVNRYLWLRPSMNTGYLMVCKTNVPGEQDRQPITA